MLGVGSPVTKIMPTHRGESWQQQPLTCLRLRSSIAVGWPRVKSTAKNMAVSIKAINTMRTSGFMPGKTIRDRWGFAPTAPMQQPARGNRRTGCGKGKITKQGISCVLKMMWSALTEGLPARLGRRKICGGRALWGEAARPHFGTCH